MSQSITTGTWYDRRRDDHQMVRRIDGEAWPPFYEHPWGRSGQGTGYDGLSKVRLTRFNPWYFARLKAFAELADKQWPGLDRAHVLSAQHFWKRARIGLSFPGDLLTAYRTLAFQSRLSIKTASAYLWLTIFMTLVTRASRSAYAYIRHCLDELS